MKSIASVSVTVLAVVLAIFLGLQLASRPDLSADLPPPFLPKQQFKTNTYPLHANSPWPETDCFIAFVMDTKCAACRRLASDLNHRGKPIPLLWIFGEPGDDVVEFIGRTGLNGRDVFLLGTPDEPLGTREAGFVASPTRIAFGARRYAYDVRVTPEVPDVSALQNLCSD